MASALSMKLCPSWDLWRRGAQAGTTLPDQSARSAAKGLAGGLAAVGLMLAAQGAQALDLSFSGFGTVGYAVSDKSYRYQRFLHDRGTFKRDTVLGAQADIKLSPQWSATYQAMLAPAVGNDADWSLRTTWAFVSWRPGNDWLLRVGKQRVPLFLNAENRDVGQTHDFARLPAELYGLSPTTDLSGFYVSRSWFLSEGEVTVDVFSGETNLTARAHARDRGPIFMPVHTEVSGAALTLKKAAATWRLGLHHAETSLRNGAGFPSHYPFAPANGFIPFDHYRVDPLMGPGVEYTQGIVNDIISLGADVEVAPNWRLITEVVRNIQMRTENGANTAGGYVALLHRMGRFTPYVSYAKLRSIGDPVRTVRQLDSIVVPELNDDLRALNASQRIAADVVQLYDQDSVALGSSFAVTPNSKLKFEWARTRIGNRSAMVDSPAGGAVVRRERINVLSLNYSFVF